MVKAWVFAWAMCVAVAATAQAIRIEAAGQGELVTVTASADLQVDAGTVWSVISDYDHLAEFIPDLRSSRVVERDGNRLIVEQTGTFGFLFFQQLVEIKLEVLESPPGRIVARAVGGNFKEMEGRYELENLPTGAVRLSYFGRMVPDFSMPPLIGRVVVRSLLEKQFVAMVNEVLRRDALIRRANHSLDRDK